MRNITTTATAQSLLRRSINSCLAELYIKNILMNEPKNQLEVDLDSESSTDISCEPRKVLFVILILPFSLNKKIKFSQLKLQVKINYSLLRLKH